MWEQKVASGQRAPPEFYEQPEFISGAAFYWQAFVDLGTERAVGMAVGPIPRSKAREYAHEYGVPFDRFWSIIRALDIAKMNLAAPTPTKPDGAPTAKEKALISKRSKKAGKLDGE